VVRCCGCWASRCRLFCCWRSSGTKGKALATRAFFFNKSSAVRILLRQYARGTVPAKPFSASSTLAVKKPFFITT
jgi:hypothetical protein